MALEEKTHLASIEVLFPSGAINARWDTVITRDGEPITAPSIHRKAYSPLDLSEIQQEIEGMLNKEYLRIAGELEAQKALLASITDERDTAHQENGQLHAVYSARINELEETVRSAMTTIQQLSDELVAQESVAPLDQEANTAATD